jgi:antitoxin component of MazEF toxin-antitoxin module
MPNILQRKILQVGDALGITIPKSVVDTYGLKKGAVIYLVTDGVDCEDFLIVDLSNRTIKELADLLGIGKR